MYLVILIDIRARTLMLLIDVLSDTYRYTLMLLIDIT